MNSIRTVDAELERIHEVEAKLTIDDLCCATTNYLEDAQVATIRQAYFFAEKAHGSQRRRSGEPYITHPLAVAHMLAMMHMDHACIIAGLLHDVIEDTEVSREQVAAAFSEEVALLVDGMSKLARAAFETRQQAQAESLRKMLLAMSKDIRVIIVKLADRLHNMRTLGHLIPEKRRRIAQETLEIYAPIAQRLGMNIVRCELEDLGFHVLYPLRYRVLASEVKKARGNRKEIMQKITDAIMHRMGQDKIDADIQGREKNLYSLYQKMVAKKCAFSDILDVYAFRIVVKDVDACYRMLGLVHNLYKPIQHRFKDYIAIPKANGYQSLHTVLVGPYGLNLEVQIRTHDMDQMAEAGVAAHWLYKVGENDSISLAHRKARQWLQGILEMQKTSGDSVEFLDNLRIDLFPEEIYVFSPAGEILTLPKSATPVDYAYAVHTSLGDHCVAAKVGRRLVPLSTQLETGQTVEIITADTAHPNTHWLNYVATAKARNCIRHYLKRLQVEEAALLGRHMLTKNLQAFSSSIDEIDTFRIAEVVAYFEADSFEHLMEQVGLGDRPALKVAQTLVFGHNTAQDVRLAPIVIAGTEGMVVNFAKCCRPIPGDHIHGYVSAGRGIVVHQDDCKNTLSLRAKSDKWLEVVWADNIERYFSVEIIVHVHNQRGVLATVAAAISESNANIENVTIDEKDSAYHDLHLLIAVQGRQHLAEIMHRLRRLDLVERITRYKQ